MNPPGAGLLTPLFDRKLVFPELRAATSDDVFGELAGRLEAAGVVRNAADLAERLRKRERDGSTGLGGGVALPHCRLKEVLDVVLAVGVSPDGIDFRAPDGGAVHVVFLILSPVEAPALHLQALARLSRLVRTAGVVARLRAAGTAEGIVERLKEAEAGSAVSSV